jgi:hypothetical protein
MYITIDKTSTYRPVSQRAAFISVTKTKPSILFRETVSFYFKNHVKKRHLLGEIEKFLTLEYVVKLAFRRLKLHLLFIPVRRNMFVHEEF